MRLLAALALQVALLAHVIAACMKRKHAADDRERRNALLSLGKSSYVSQTGMAKLLQATANGNLPEHFSRTTQYRARKGECNQITPYGKLIEHKTFQLAKGEEVTIGFANPFAMFHEQCRRSNDFSKIVAEALERHPCSPSSPWHIIFYQDGVDPSDGLAKHHSRKSSVFYYSFLQLGQRALAHEEVWCTLTIMREHKARGLSDGIATLASEAIGMFFKDEHDIRRAGVHATLRTGSRVHIIAEIGVILADALAFKEILGCKGHNGTKPCLLCMNCTHHKPPGGAAPIHLTSDYCVPLTDVNFDRFIKFDSGSPNTSIRDTVKRLHAFKDTLDADAFELKEQIMGWGYCPTTMVLNDRFRLDIENLIMFDWAHVYVCDGLLAQEVGLCMSAFRTARDHDITYENLGKYCEGWTFPGRRSVEHLFTEQKARSHYKASSFSSSGSELVTLVPVLLRYFQHVVLPRGCLVKHVECVIACLLVVMLLLATRLSVVSPDELRDAIFLHLSLFREVYGDDYMRPKHHYSLHLPSMLARFGVLLTTFVNERKHRIVKQYTRNRCNPQSWDLSSLEDVTVHQLWELDLPFFNMFSTTLPSGRVFHALRELFPGIPDDCFTLHNQLKLHGGTSTTRDVVSFALGGRVEVGRLMLAVGINLGAEVVMYALVSKWAFLGDSADGTLRNLSVRDDLVSVLASDLETIFTYRMADDGATCAIHVPHELRANVV